MVCPDCRRGFIAVAVRVVRCKECQRKKATREANERARVRDRERSIFVSSICIQCGESFGWRKGRNGRIRVECTPCLIRKGRPHKYGSYCRVSPYVCRICGKAGYVRGKRFRQTCGEGRCPNRWLAVLQWLRRTLGGRVAEWTEQEIEIGKLKWGIWQEIHNLEDGPWRHYR